MFLWFCMVILGFSLIVRPVKVFPIPGAGKQFNIALAISPEFHLIRRIRLPPLGIQPQRAPAPSLVPSFWGTVPFLDS